MSATTLRTILNRVLTAVGETPVDVLITNITDILQLKILEFLNQFKEEMEDATYWRTLRQSISNTVLANTNNIAIAGTDERARVIRAYSEQAGVLVPLVFDITASNNPIPLLELPLDELLYRYYTDASGTTTVQPSYFSIDVSSGQAVLYVYPTPNTQRTIVTTMHVPQATLLASDLDTAIKIPTLPLLKGTIWYTLLDRGEEMGAQGTFTEERYRTSLDDAISRDVSESGSLDQLIVN